MKLYDLAYTTKLTGHPVFYNSLDLYDDQTFFSGSNDKSGNYGTLQRKKNKINCS